MDERALTALRIIAAAMVLGVLWWARDLLAPLCLSIFFALTLNPAVARLDRFCPRPASAAVVLGVALGAMTLAAYSLTDDAARAVEGLPGTARRVRQVVQQAAGSRGVLASLDRALGEIQRIWTANAAAPATPLDLRAEVLRYAGRAGAWSTTVIALVFLTYFLLATGDSIKLKLVRLSGEQLSNRKITVQVVDELITRVSQFVVYLVLSGIFVGVATWLAFLWLGVAYAALWGLAAGLLNAIPYLGPALVMFASAIAALVQFQSLGMAAGVAGASVVITTVEGFVIGTVVFGRLARIHPVAVFLSIMFWGWLWGPIGTFLAVPIVTAIKTIVDYLPNAGTAAEVLSDGKAPADAGAETSAAPSS